MALITVTPKDRELNKPWDAGWHRAIVVEILEEASKSKDSINYLPVFEEADENWKPTGKLLSKFAALMNSKNQGMFMMNFLPFADAVMGSEAMGSLDTEKFKGKALWIEVGKSTYNGSLVDKVTGFASKERVPF